MLEMLEVDKTKVLAPKVPAASRNAMPNFWKKHLGSPLRTHFQTFIKGIRRKN